MIFHYSKHYEDHLSNEFENLSRFCGEPLRYISGLKLYAKPSAVKFIGDYGNTVLIEMEFIDDIWNANNPKPRYIRHAIPKSALACCEVQLISAFTGEPLHGSTVVPHRVRDEEVFIP